MFNQLKIKLSERFDDKAHAQLEEVLKKAELQYNVHYIENPCVHPHHHHEHMTLVEIINPPGELHTFVNVQANWGGKRYLIQVVRAEDLATVGIGYGSLVPTFKKFLVPMFEHLRDHIVLEWIEYRMNA